MAFYFSNLILQTAKITAKLSNAHELLHQEAENFDWENL